MKTLKIIFEDLDALDTQLKKLRDRLFWYQYREAAACGQIVYQEAGHIAASLELLADKNDETKLEANK